MLSSATKRDGGHTWWVLLPLNILSRLLVITEEVCVDIKCLILFDGCKKDSPK